VRRTLTPIVQCRGPLRPLTREASVDALSIPIKDAGADFDLKRFEPILDFSEGHPLTLRMAGSATWKFADENAGEGQLAISEQHVANAIEATRHQFSWTYYEPMWTQSDAGERELLKTMASKPGGVSRRLLARDIPDARDLLRALRNRGVVHDGDHPAFTIPGFREFVNDQRGTHGGEDLGGREIPGDEEDPDTRPTPDIRGDSNGGGKSSRRRRWSIGRRGRTSLPPLVSLLRGDAERLSRPASRG
jgi:hypothetical protein